MTRSIHGFTLGAILLSASVAWAVGQASPEEAKAMAVKAANI